MLLVWRGWGIAIPVIVILIQLAVEQLADQITGSPGFRQMPQQHRSDRLQ